FVAFASEANSLSGADNNNYRNVFVRDLQTNTTTYVSRASGSAGAAGDDDSDSDSISADGRYVAFDSKANDLSGADNNTYKNIFVRDLKGTNTTTYVSRASGATGTAGDGDSCCAS